jgi:GDP-L-fucose synthase
LGSSCIYPKHASQPIKESSLLSGLLEQTNEGYAIAKIAGVRLARAFHDEFGFDYLSLMPTNLYGPNDNFDYFSAHAPAALMRRFHEAKVSGARQVSVWGSGNQIREFMHVDDLASACWYFLEKKLGGDLINIGTGIGISISDFASLISEIVGFEGLVTYQTDKPDGTPKKVLDVTRACEYGWSSKISLREGLETTYAWFKKSWERGELRGQ